MDNKELTRGMFIAMAKAAEDFLNENDKYLNNLGELFQLMVGSHMTSLYNQLMFAANLAKSEEEREQAKKEVNILFKVLQNALESTPFGIEKTLFGATH